MILPRLLPLALVAALAGCGGAEAEREAPASGQGDRAAVEKAVKAYFAGLASGDAASACRQLSEPAQEEVGRRYGAGSCEAQLAKVVEQAPPEAIEELRDPPIDRVDVAGDAATVTFAPTEFAPQGGAPPLKLRRESGRWVISALPAQGSVKPTRYASCVAGGIGDFDKGDVDPFWKKQPRDVYVMFVRRVCRRADRRGIDSSDDRFSKIVSQVIVEMAKRGEIPLPR